MGEVKWCKEKSNESIVQTQVGKVVKDENVIIHEMTRHVMFVIRNFKSNMPEWTFRSIVRPVRDAFF